MRRRPNPRGRRRPSPACATARGSDPGQPVLTTFRPAHLLFTPTPGRARRRTALPRRRTTRQRRMPAARGITTVRRWIPCRFRPRCWSTKAAPRAFPPSGPHRRGEHGRAGRAANFQHILRQCAVPPGHVQAPGAASAGPRHDPNHLPPPRRRRCRRDPHHLHVRGRRALRHPRAGRRESSYRLHPFVGTKIPAGVVYSRPIIMYNRRRAAARARGLHQQRASCT